MNDQVVCSHDYFSIPMMRIALNGIPVSIPPSHITSEKNTIHVVAGFPRDSHEAKTAPTCAQDLQIPQWDPKDYIFLELDEEGYCLYKRITFMAHTIGKGIP